MEQILETYKSTKQYFNLLLTITATGFILLLSPKENNFEKPLAELNALKSLDLNDYERYIRGFCGGSGLLPNELKEGHIPSWSRNITYFIDSLYAEGGENLNLITEEFPNPDWNVIPIVEYDEPPVDGTVSEWENWIKSNNNAKYYTPDWNTARMSSSRAIGATPVIIRHFLIKQSEFKRNPGEYAFRGYLDLKFNEIDTSQYANIRSKRHDWWTKYDTMEFRSLFELKGNLRDSIDSEYRFIIEGEVNSFNPQTLEGTGVYNWLSKSKRWTEISSNNELGESILPGLHSVWTDVSDKTLNDAYITLMNERNNSKTVNIFGLSVSFLLALILVPIAFLFAEIFLLLHLSQLNKEISIYL